jgi:hypothetical protein
VARFLPAVPVLLMVPVLLAVPVSEGAFEPQPVLITLIRATIAKAASGRSVRLMVAPWCVELG